MKPLWLHQEQGIGNTLLAIDRGERRICLSSPTGGGKTRMIEELIHRWTEEGLRTTLYTNRRLLLDQLSSVLDSAGIDHGIRAAGEANRPHCPVQIASIQTEGMRAIRGGDMLSEAHRVVVDEAHVQTGPEAREIMKRHGDAGAVLLGVTATPLGIGDLYDHLIVSGTTSELRQCGALVAARHFGCDEPDLAAWKKAGKLKGWAEGDDMSERQAASVMMTNGIFGRVGKWFLKLNPEMRPTILFAPGIAESRWFAQQFFAAGITAAHIDGDYIWRNGEEYPATREARQEVLDGSRAGRICVLCNRFVLREGIDAPWLSHGIFATIFGSLQTYLQSGGRLLRHHDSLSQVTIQDHGGNWWRHGSLNADREWRLEYTSGIAHGMRAERLRGKLCKECGVKLKPRRPLCLACGALNETEPGRCPECAQIVTGPRCPCGWVSKSGKRSRAVVSTDGTLKELTGDVFKPHSICKRPDGPKLWERMYHRSLTEKGRRTFRSAFTLFAQENYWQWPSLDWPLMPLELFDQFRLIEDVPYERLVPK